MRLNACLIKKIIVCTLVEIKLCVEKSIDLNYVCKTDFHRIDIVESEFGKMHRSRRNNKTGRRLLIDTDTSPEFLCEKVYVQVKLNLNSD